MTIVIMIIIRKSPVAAPAMIAKKELLKKLIASDPGLGAGFIAAVKEINRIV